MKAEEIIKKILDCEIYDSEFNKNDEFTLQDFAEALTQVREMETALTWSCKQMKWKEDDLRQNLIDGTEGGYSEELTSILTLLEKIRKNK